MISNVKGNIMRKTIQEVLVLGIVSVIISAFSLRFEEDVTLGQFTSLTLIVWGVFVIGFWWLKGVRAH